MGAPTIRPNGGLHDKVQAFALRVIAGRLHLGEGIPELDELFAVGGEAKPIRIPAGLPCRVMTTASFAARRRYLDKASFTSFSATVFIRFSRLPKAEKGRSWFPPTGESGRSLPSENQNVPFPPPVRRAIP